MYGYGTSEAIKQTDEKENTEMTQFIVYDWFLHLI